MRHSVQKTKGETYARGLDNSGNIEIYSALCALVPSRAHPAGAPQRGVVRLGHDVQDG